MVVMVIVMKIVSAFACSKDIKVLAALPVKHRGHASWTE